MSEEKEYYRYKNIEAYKIALAKPPSDGWILNRSLGGKRQTDYEPVQVKQALADLVFRTWNVESETYTVVLNEIICTVKISALPDYPGADFEYLSGSGAHTIACDKGSKPIDFPEGKKSNALEYCMPAARTKAIGCAFQDKGNLFGRNVGRGDVTNDFGFDLTYNKDD